MTIFKGITDIGDQSYTDALKANIITYLDYGFADAGGYNNVQLSDTGQYGGSQDVLYSVDNPNYTDLTVWQSNRKNWVWENDLEIGSPISISGVWVNDTLMTSGYNVDYNNGRVIFDTALSASDNVQIEYSYKYVAVEDNDSLPFFKVLQKDSERFDDNLRIVDSGNNLELVENRVQMPVIGVNVLTDRKQNGYQIGNFDKVVRDRIVLNIFAQTDTQANMIADTILKQQNQTIFMYNPKAVAEDQAFPLNYNGYLVNPSSSYRELIQPTGVGGYRYTDGVQAGKLYFADISAENGAWMSDEFYHKTVRITTETILYI